MEISHLMALITSRLNAPEPMIRLVGEVFQIIFWEVLRIIFWGGVADYFLEKELRIIFLIESCLTTASSPCSAEPSFKRQSMA